MICPNCKTDDDKVVASLPDGHIFWRVRQCKKCSHEWETSESEDTRIGRTVKEERMRRINKNR